MPKAMEKHLRDEVNKKHPDWSKEHKAHYIYGAMINKTSWRPNKKK